MPANRSQASEQFVTAVKEFEEKHGKKLSEFLTIEKDSQPANQALVSEFFTNPIIHNYLVRKADTIRFLNNKPCDSCLTSVELEIYSLRPDLFPFRKDATKSRFYLSGLNTNKNLFKSLQMRFNNANLKITSSMDIYEIREHLNQHAYMSQHSEPNTKESLSKVKFILTPNWKDTHATTLAHILDPETGQVLASVFINSWDKKEYSEYISYRFNLKDNYQITFYSQQNGIQHIPAQHITERELPFIDASHHLQVTNDDQNCTLYGAYFLEAIAKMLSDPLMADQIFDLAKSINQKNPEALTTLQDIFQNKLKDYLPCYYENKKIKAFSDIKGFHLAKRWDLGSEILSMVYPVKPEAGDLVSEPKRLKTFESSFDEEGKCSGLHYSGKNKVIQYVFAHVISILNNEKSRLLQKYPPIKDLNRVIELDGKYKRPENKLERVDILDTLIDQIYQQLGNFEEDPQANSADLKKSLASLFTSQLSSGVLDKYQGWGEKLALVLLNALFFLPLVTLPVKKMITGSWFFSLEGKTQEVAKTALDQMAQMPTSR